MAWNGSRRGQPLPSFEGGEIRELAERIARDCVLGVWLKSTAAETQKALAADSQD